MSKHMLKRIVILVLVAALTLIVGAVAAQEATEEPTPDTTPRPYLGVSLSDTDDTDDGVLILQVMPGSPADEAGIRAGDVISAINDTATPTAQAAADVISALSVGDEIEVTTLYRGVERTFTVTLAEYPPMTERGLNIPRGRGQIIPPGDMPFGFEFRGAPGGEGRGERLAPFGGMRLGVSFIALDADTAAEYAVDVEAGALLTMVIEESPAAEAGLQVNDVITMVNGEAITADYTLRDAIFATENDLLVLTVLRDGEELTLEVMLGEARLPSNAPGLRFRDLPLLEPEMLPEVTAEPNL